MLFELKESFPAYYRYYGRRIAKRLSPSLNKIFENSYKKFSIDQNILDIISNKIGSKKFILKALLLQPKFLEALELREKVNL